MSNMLLVVGKITIGLVIGSVGVLSEGIHSSIDLIAAVIAFFAIKQASVPADSNHRYGHGKIENISGVVEGLLIFGAGVWIIYESISKFVHPGKVEFIGWGIAIMSVSSLVNLFVSRYLYKIGNETDSIALKADAAHLKTDIITSVGVAIGLVGVYLTGYQWIDPLAAIIVACIIIYTSYEIIHEAIAPLLDSSLDSATENKILKVIEEFKGDYLFHHNLRTRKSGSTKYIDFRITLCKHMTMIYVDRLTYAMTYKLRLHYNNIDALILPEACNNECNGCDRACKATKVEVTNNDTLCANK
jgi:cation diffusion facilitator family transporter